MVFSLEEDSTMCRTVGSHRHLTRTQRAFILECASSNGNGVSLKEVCRLLKKEFQTGFNLLAVQKFLNKNNKNTGPNARPSTKKKTKKTKRPYMRR